MMMRSNRIGLFQGTLDLLVLRILRFGSLHGHRLTPTGRKQQLALAMARLLGLGQEPL
jgi:hypothetical protein